jgi:pre-rRNA-processing protein IPI3
VTALAFSDGGYMLVSGGEDTMVHVWLVMDALDAAGHHSTHSMPISLHSWSDHTLPVTGLFVGAGGANAIVATSSLDHSCHIYSLGQGVQLTSNRTDGRTDRHAGAYEARQADYRSCVETCEQRRPP